MIRLSKRNETMPKSAPSKTVCIFTSIEGHRSIADAIEELLQEDYKVCLYIERDDIFNYYVLFYQFFPGVYKLPYTLVKNKHVLQFLGHYFKEKYYDKMKAFCDEHQPDMCISTYFMYNSSLTEIAKERNIPFINIVTDPRTVHPIILSEEAKTNVVFDHFQKKYCHAQLKSAQYDVYGWLTRAKFEQPYKKEKIRQKIHLEPEKLTFLIASGSEGTNIVSKIFPSLMSSTHPLQIVVACGHNKTLYKSVKILSDMLKKSKSLATLIPLRFTHEIHLYIQAADLVIGKAGPNTIFEAAAAQVPFFAITHISGQEDGNLDIINEYKLGYVEENPFKAAKLLTDIIAEPNQLKEFAPHLKKMAKMNHDGKHQLKKYINTLLEKSA